MSITTAKPLITVDEYYQMVRDGILIEQDRVELIEGEIHWMSPIGNRHAGCGNCLIYIFSPLIPKKAILSSQNPIHLNSNNEPQPDFVLLKSRQDFYRTQHPNPSDVLLIIEISDTTLEYDRNVKLPLYARFGIPEVWLVNLPDNRIEVYRDPSSQGYKTVLNFQNEQAFSPLAFPEVVITAKEVLG